MFDYKRIQLTAKAQAISDANWDRIFNTQTVDINELSADKEEDEE